MTAYLIDWLSLVGRWVHLITGIAWIGSSFYFVWLDNHLLKPANAADSVRGVGGELWSVHGGGFYHAQKYRVSPPTLPATLHWFYWEAYSTFLSGTFLLTVLYFGQAEIYLIDPQVAQLTKPMAILAAIGFLVGGWLVYDGLCRTKLAKNGRVVATLVALLLAGAAYALCHLFAGRAAFILFGATLGSIMVANVFFVIIPGQRRTVAALRDGREPDPEDGKRGKLRSVHNTYFTLPVLFTMISNHYAVTFGAQYNWLVLITMCAGGALIRAWFVARHHAAVAGTTAPRWTVATGVAMLVGVAVALAPRTAAPIASGDDAATQFARVQSILTTRCVACHAAEPSQPGFAAAPKGVMLQTPEQILAQLPVMEVQLASRVMPIGNLTGMTEDERAYVLDWIRRGARH